MIYSKTKLKQIGWTVLFALFVWSFLGPLAISSQAEGKSNYKAEKELYKLTTEIKKKLGDQKKIPPETFREAIDKYRALAEKYPQWESTPGLYFRIAELYRAQGKIEPFIEELKNIAKIFPDNDRIYLQALSTVATTYERMKDFEQAIAQYREIIKQYLEKKPLVVANAKFSIGRILDENEEWEKAIKEFTEITADYPKTPQAIQVPIYIAGHYRKTKETDLMKQAYQKAVADYQKKIAEHPNTPMSIMAKQFLAEAYVGLDELGKAKEITSGLIELLPKNASLHSNLARISLREKNFEQAIVEFEKTLELTAGGKSAPPGTYLDLIRLYLNSKQGEKAVSLMEKEIEKNPENVIAYNLLGDIYMALGKHDASAAQFKKAIEINPKLPMSYNNLGLHYLRFKKWKEAVKNFKKAVELNPKYLLAQINLATTYEQMQQDKNAEETYRKVIELSPKNLPAYNNLAWLYAKNEKRLEEATQLALKAASLNPDDANVKDTLGWIYYLRGEYKKALESLLASVKVIDKHPSIRYHLGVTYQKLGRLSEAQAELEKALAFNVDFPEKAKTTAALKQIKKR